jgi:hypothetical protein
VPSVAEVFYPALGYQLGDGKSAACRVFRRMVFASDQSHSYPNRRGGEPLPGRRVVATRAAAGFSDGLPSMLPPFIGVRLGR